MDLSWTCVLAPEEFHWHEPQFLQTSDISRKLTWPRSDAATNSHEMPQHVFSVLVLVSLQQTTLSKLRSLEEHMKPWMLVNLNWDRTFKGLLSFSILSCLTLLPVSVSLISGFSPFITNPIFDTYICTLTFITSSLSLFCYCCFSVCEREIEGGVWGRFDIFIALIFKKHLCCLCEKSCTNKVCLIDWCWLIFLNENGRISNHRSLFFWRLLALPQNL